MVVLGKLSPIVMRVLQVQPAKGKEWSSQGEVDQAPA